MVFTYLPLTQEFKTLGMDNYLWVQALFNHEELERLRGQEPNDPHQRFLWRIIRMGVIDPEATDKAMNTSTRSMRHSSAIGMRLWKMWRGKNFFSHAYHHLPNWSSSGSYSLKKYLALATPPHHTTLCQNPPAYEL